MNEFELKYSLLAIIFLAIASYTIFHSQLVLGFLLMIIGLFFGIKSTNPKKPKWFIGVLISLAAIVLGCWAAGLLLN
jgi:hypothetical protein